MNPPMSSRLNPKVIWVRSLVPKEKNSQDGGHLVGQERGAGDLDHRAVLVLQFGEAELGEDFGVDAVR